MQSEKRMSKTENPPMIDPTTIHTNAGLGPPRRICRNGEDVFPTVMAPVVVTLAANAMSQFSGLESSEAAISLLGMCCVAFFIIVVAIK